MYFYSNRSQFAQTKFPIESERNKSFKPNYNVLNAITFAPSTFVQMGFGHVPYI